MITIAVSGKGGTGKTTLAACIIRWLKSNNIKPILAVDADPNTNLNELLGIKALETIGSIREEMRTRSSELPAGMTKHQFLEYKIQSSLVETPDFDLIAMGRPEGPGCYCYANNILRDILKSLSHNYRAVIIDNEAGMEHLSRRTVQRIDHLLITSSPSARGIQAAGRISRLIQELNSRVSEKHLVLNRVRESLSAHIEKAIKEEHLTLLNSLPEDPEILEWDQTGKPIILLPDSSPFYKAVDQMMTRIMGNTPL
jgi:CO dehydrogenase maturation factor